MKTTALLSAVPAPNLRPHFGNYPVGSKLTRISAVKGYGKLRLRPIALDDEQAMIRFHENISEESIYRRYFQYMGMDHRTSHERLVKICTNTPESYAIILERITVTHHQSKILGVGRLTTTTEPCVATFDTLIAEEESPQLGKALLIRLIKLAKEFGFEVLMGELLLIDHEARNLCRELGFSLQTMPKDALVQVRFSL